MNDQLRKEEDALLYEPVPVISKEFIKEFKRLVPMSPNGKDRMLRFVWGNDRKEYIAGQWTCRYGDMDNIPAKYQGRCRWILEGWQPPDIYDKAEWVACGSLLGEYPANGVFDFLAYHVDDADEYLPLDESALKRVRSWLWWQGQGKKRSIQALMEAKVTRRTLQDQRRKEAADAVAQKFGEDVVRCFEAAKNTPDAYSLPLTKVMDGKFEQTPSGLIIPRN